MNQACLQKDEFDNVTPQAAEALSLSLMLVSF